ncbi:hypothetical protein BH20BAC1_BH20BAC1_23940 [soil metagenome]
MSHIYCISGFGADERIFSKLDFGKHEVHYVPWLLPEKTENIRDYARRTTKAIAHPLPILLGVSFGGMMCIEIAKSLPVQKVVLISSIKTAKEIPTWMKIAGKLQLQKIFPLRSFKLFEPVQNYNLGIETKEELKLVRHYRQNVSQQYTDWAVNEILNWKNIWLPDNLIHIHGSKDHMFPLRKLHADYIIPGAGHFMVMNRAEKVNEILTKIL